MTSAWRQQKASGNPGAACICVSAYMTRSAMLHGAAGVRPLNRPSDKQQEPGISLLQETGATPFPANQSAYTAPRHTHTLICLVFWHRAP